MDRYKADMLSPKEFSPNTSIFNDRFNLEKYIIEAIDKICRKEVKYHQKLKNSRYA